MEYITSEQLSEKWGIGTCRILCLAREGRIEGAKQIGKSWVFPANAEKPADGRTRQAKKELKTEFFRFPLYMNFSEDSFSPPLSQEEKQLRQAQLDFFACEFDRAESIFAGLSEKSSSVYIRIAALFFRCIISTHGKNGVGFSSLSLRLSMELKQDFPHKREMELFLPLLYGYFAEYKAAAEQLTFTPDYSYSPDCLPMLALLSFFHLSQASPETDSRINITVYELSCKQAEQGGHFYEALEMHFMLFIVYHLTLNKTRMFYHLQKGLTIAHVHNLILIPACYAFFFPNEFSKALAEYPAAFSAKIRQFGKSIRESFSRFSAQKNSANIYKDLSQNDYQFVYYATMGYSNRKVAGFMRKSEKTVVNRYNEIYDKLGISGKRELVALMNTTLVKKESAPDCGTF